MKQMSKISKSEPVFTEKDIGMISLSTLNKVTSKKNILLAQLGLNSIKDLFYYFPYRWEEYELGDLRQITHREIVFVPVTIKEVNWRQLDRKRSMIEALVADSEGLAIAIWFNQPYLRPKLFPGCKVFIRGKTDYRFGRPQIVVSESFFAAEEFDTGIMPVYTLKKGLTQRFMRDLVKEALQKYGELIRETMPPSLLSRYKFLTLPEAIKEIHFPTNWQMLQAAKKRLIWDELFILQLGIKFRGLKKEKVRGIALKGGDELVSRFLSSLPFSLTGAQERVLQEVFRDMEQEKVMTRLIQGDVGSGKTIIAAAALLKAVGSGYQGAFMAPTEILAQQHYLNLEKLFQPLGVTIELLVGSTPEKKKEEILKNIACGQIDIVVGTHALIEDKVRFLNLGIAITDEQHRFGVRQRGLLQEKGSPDVLLMSATPIPRTLAMVLYGDLDVSIVDELPPGRKKVESYFVPPSKEKPLWQFVRTKLEKGEQAYVVCPLIEESEEMDLKATVAVFEELKKTMKPFEIALLHGKLSANEKSQIIKDFRENKIKILVTTTVIEVGLDVPNATLMIIEDAQRFGLAQLHQLRGRIGRGSEKSFCFLLGNPRTKESRARLKAFVATNDGFVLAEEDLKLRGPGDFFGSRQHGLPELKIADLTRNVRLLTLASKEAEKYLAADPSLKRYPLWQRIIEEKFDKVIL